MKKISTLSYIKNKIIINGYENVVAPANIIRCLLIDDLIILLLDADKLKSFANVYCYDVEGILKWVISQPIIINGCDYYTSIYVRSDLFLYAYNINGIEAKLNYLNGEILDSELIK